MSQLKYTKGTLYIRRFKEGDQADSIFDAMRMAANQLLNKRNGKDYFYVAVRRGHPSTVVATGRCRRDIQRQFIGRSWRSTQKFFRTAKKGAS